MDKVIVERALRALAEVGAVRAPVPKPPSVVLRRSAEVREKTAEVVVQYSAERTAPCGSPQCAGCYDVGDGKKIHPPKCGDGYRAWLERWKGRGRVQ